jgi:alpha-tubulin suppressor-like RCC1 family protein
MRDDVRMAENVPQNPQIDTFYTISGLQPDTGYFIKVTATNEDGEGYSPKEPFYVLTMSSQINICDSLYVWGNNASSEIGLNDETVEANKAHYQGCRMTKPIRHAMFNGIVYQVATGNVNSLFLCADQ